MGTYYRYVNFTRQEFVQPHGLDGAGDKEGPALSLAPALAWLLVWPHTCGDGYRGRWSHRRDLSVRGDRAADDVRIITDSEVDFSALDVDEDYLDITPGLLQSMREQVPGIVRDWRPRSHDVRLTQRVRDDRRAIYVLADPCRAVCSCGWDSGEIRGQADDRERILERVTSNHVLELGPVEAR